MSFYFIEGVIRGLDVALATMRKGEISKYIFSPEYAYKEMGCPPRIPPNATGMNYTVDLSDNDVKCRLQMLHEI